MWLAFGSIRWSKNMLYREEKSLHFSDPLPSRSVACYLTVGLLTNMLLIP